MNDEFITYMKEYSPLAWIAVEGAQSEYNELQRLFQYPFIESIHAITDDIGHSHISENSPESASQRASDFMYEYKGMTIKQEHKSTSSQTITLKGSRSRVHHKPGKKNKANGEIAYVRYGEFHVLSVDFKGKSSGAFYVPAHRLPRHPEYRNRYPMSISEKILAPIMSTNLEEVLEDVYMNHDRECNKTIPNEPQSNTLMKFF